MDLASIIFFKNLKININNGKINLTILYKTGFKHHKDYLVDLI